MPATAGRVRMPANNRVHSSAALQTHGIWQSAIGYDPYAPNKDESKQSTELPGSKSANEEPDAENAYASFQGLLALARITGSNADEARGACKKCGRVGHLTFQCRNFISVKTDGDKDKDPSVALQAVASVLDKTKANGIDTAIQSSEESSEEEESESSDSDADSEIERIIATRNRKKVGCSKVKSSSKRRGLDEVNSDSGGKRKRKRGRSRKRKSRKRASRDSDEEDDGDRKRMKEKKKRSKHAHSDGEDEKRPSVDSDEESDGDRRRKEKKRSGHGHSNGEDRHRRHRKSRKEKKRRRSHHHSDSSEESEDSDGHRKRKGRRSSSLTDSGSSSDDTRIGRGTKQSEKKRIGKRACRE